MSSGGFEPPDLPINSPSWSRSYVIGYFKLRRYLFVVRVGHVRNTFFPTLHRFFPALPAPRVELEGSNIKTLCQDLARQLSSIANNRSRSCWQTSKFLRSDHISGQHDGAKTANPALVISRLSEDVQRGPNMQLSRGVHKTPSGDPAKQVKNHQSLAQVFKSSNFLSLLLGPVDSQAFLLPPLLVSPLFALNILRHASSQAAISKGTARHVVSGKSRHVPIIHNETLRNSWEYSEISWVGATRSPSRPDLNKLPNLGKSAENQQDVFGWIRTISSARKSYWKIWDGTEFLLNKDSIASLLPFQTMYVFGWIRRRCHTGNFGAPDVQSENSQTGFELHIGCIKVS
ncbi:hypothetical protein DFH07DRAFT_1036585 [Mycena maculata]|uniref:Uncharacterized protein n=1 Tax=Mycena maculata TaxID=230809 RepID=A0AAD7IS80_9AGAR|nr:hypothetical protein DFH07DRAFT_1036585 [Mycena maculata]